MTKTSYRMAGVFGFAMCLGVLALAAYLTPDPSGIGTHSQVLGGPCMFFWLTGVPCATCGMTTSFAHMVRLEVARAAVAQPVGVLLFLALVLIGVPMSVYAAATGRGTILRQPTERLALIALIALLAGWLYKICSYLLM